ncbi:hypothetical protein OIU77_002144 [Salix suchowensis]|uniref:Uncharacterized protein n=1 Tax=Salix suchowensis TaxID=1278906 RepID=A0ABQ9B3S2_9ROSI|nr:hypothetical protein OIU77_002144 [Salix suchowensis]
MEVKLLTDISKETFPPSMRNFLTEGIIGILVNKGQPPTCNSRRRGKRHASHCSNLIIESTTSFSKDGNEFCASPYTWLSIHFTPFITHNSRLLRNRSFPNGGSCSQL